MCVYNNKNAMQYYFSTHKTSTGIIKHKFRVDSWQYVIYGVCVLFILPEFQYYWVITLESQIWDSV